jgi:hypothetical protein
VSVTKYHGTKTSRCLIKCKAMKTYDGVEVSLPEFLTLALDGGEGSASRRDCLTSVGGASDTPRLDAVV